MSDASSVSSTHSQPSSHSASRGGRRWQCFLGCGQRYMKSSGRSIRRHVLSCYRRHFEAECNNRTDAQIHELLVAQEENGAIVTGLKRWRLRRSRRLAMDLPAHERWDCPNRCGRYFRSTSSRSIAKHKNSCRHTALQADYSSQVPSPDTLTASSSSSSSSASSTSSSSLLSSSVHSSSPASLAAVLTPSSSSASTSSFASFASSSSSSPHLLGAQHHYYSAPHRSQSTDTASPSSAASASTSVSASSASPASLPQLLTHPHPSALSLSTRLGPPSESHTTLRLSEPTYADQAATAANKTTPIIRPIPRLLASLPTTATSTPFVTQSTTTAGKPTQQPPPPPPLSLSLPLLHPSSSSLSSAFTPLNPCTPSALSSASASFSQPFFNLSPLHALSTVRAGYLVCSFQNQQIQVPVLSWPY